LAHGIHRVPIHTRVDLERVGKKSAIHSKQGPVTKAPKKLQGNCLSAGCKRPEDKILLTRKSTHKESPKRLNREAVCSKQLVKPQRTRKMYSGQLKKATTMQKEKEKKDTFVLQRSLKQKNANARNKGRRRSSQNQQNKRNGTTRQDQAQERPRLIHDVPIRNGNAKPTRKLTGG